MPSNVSFQPDQAPLLRDHPSLELIHSRVSSPFSFFNPTRAHFRHLASAIAGHDENHPPASGLVYKWSSRDNRKGRHALQIRDHSRAAHTPSIQSPPASTTGKAVLRGVWRMLTAYPYWDVSWLVAYAFTWGSIVWVLNAFFVWLPLARPDSEFANELLYGGGITAFVGATIFEIGSVLLLVEAMNPNRAGCFGWAVEQVVEQHGPHRPTHGPSKDAALRVMPDMDQCGHHHANKRNLVGKGTSDGDMGRGGLDGDAAAAAASWAWWPSRHDFRDMGFVASLVQLVGATVFWIAGYTVLPGIYDHLSPGLLDGVYWTPQVVGGTGFILSGLLFMLENQKHWWRPAFGVLGWHIGFWNLVGGVGFTICPAFGYDTHSWAQYQAALSTFWGSWAFLIGSVLQLYESLDKSPVAIIKQKEKSEDVTS